MSNLQSRLGDLPLDVLEHICSCLDRLDLLRLSLVNRKCRSSSMPYIFRTVNLTFSTPEALRFDVERFHKQLTASSCFARVYDVHILTDQLLPESGTTQHVDCGDQPAKTWKYCRFKSQDSNILIPEEGWQTLNGLIEQRPALRNIFWCHDQPIPLSLLRYINESSPRCKLHLRSFKLRSAYALKGQANKISAYDLELATSPCVSSIALMHDYTEQGYTNWNLDAVKEMIGGAAPGLRAVSVLHETSPWHPGGHTLSQTNGRWRPGTICSEKKLGALQHLELSHGNSNTLKEWSTITDFSLLRTLKRYKFIAAPEFRWLVENCRLSSLRTLCVKPGGGDTEEAREDLSDATEDFIRSLPPLQSVKLVSLYTQRTMSVVLEHCGDSLRELYLGLPYKDSPMTFDDLNDSVFANPRMLALIQTHCPNLEVLALPMLRSQGDAHEVSLYRSFGQMPKLRKLYLSLYGAQPFYWIHEWSAVQEFERILQSNDKDEMKDIRNAFVDFAIDERLAKSICHTISAAKAPYSTPLETLELRVVKLCHPLGPRCAMFDMIKMLRHVAHSWICNRRFGAEEERFECVVMDPRQADKASFDRSQWHIKQSERPEDAELQFESVVKDVWDGMSVDEWREGWHSFPLAE